MLGVVATIQLIALDLDGTLLDPSDNISSANREAISQSLAAGIRVVFVTGRGVDAPERIATDLGINLPVICAHGALTKDFKSGKVIGHIPVALQYAKPMLEFAEANALHAAAYTGEHFYRLARTPRYMNDMTGPTWCELESFREVLHTAPTFLRFFGRDAVAAIRETFVEMPVHFKYETWGEFEELAVTSMGATKKNALARLCADYKIESRHVLAVGDSRNDVPMLRWAGIGVAMGNALAEVKAAVPYLTASNADDGVALAIRRFVFDRSEEEKTA